MSQLHGTPHCKVADVGQLDPGSAIREIRLRLQTLESELQRLHNEKAALEGELTEYKQKVIAQARELEVLRQEAQRHSAASAVIASESRPKFHRLNCEYAEDILRLSHRHVYKNREEAIADGKKPCGTCCP